LISIVIIYNDEKMLNEYFLKGLKSQSSRHELILIDNRTGVYKSAAKAFNDACKKAKGDYIMCVHQDVELLSSDFLKTTEMMLDGLADVGVAGVAGMSMDGRTHKERRKNIIYHGFPEKQLWGNKIDSPIEVQTLDECLLIIPRKIFEIIKFDEETCNNWHLYGVDYCLSVKEMKMKVYTLPLTIYHRSKGESAISSDSFFRLGSKKNEYYVTLKKVLKKHKNHFKKICTTCGDWHTAYPIFLQRIYHFLQFSLFNES